MNGKVTTERFCLNCGRERQVDGETGRCLTCGRPTARGEVLEQLRKSATVGAAKPASSIASPAPPEKHRLRLPSNPATRHWVKQTQALADGLKRAADEARVRAQAATEEAERLSRAAAAFAGLLDQVEVPVESETVRHQWSRKFEACQKCGKTEHPHKAHGMCSRCWRPS